MGGDYCQKFFIYFIHIKIIMKGGGRIMKGPPSLKWTIILWYPVVLHKPRSRQRGMVS